MSKKRALITGITGQDGSYLAEYLLSLGYEVHGIVRRVALEDQRHRMWRIRDIQDKLRIHSGSLESYASIYNIVSLVNPDECYHLAAQSFVSYSFEDEFSTLNSNINGTHYVLSAIKNASPDCKFYFAASSEMFGKAQEVPQSEKTKFHPRSVYGISKVAGYDLTRNYREAYNLFAVGGILFNHESLPAFSPVIIKKDGLVDILPINEFFNKSEKHLYDGIKKEYKNQWIWNGEEWSRIKNGTAYIRKGKKLNLIQTRDSCVELTDEHCLFDEKNNEIKAEDVKVGHKLYKVKLPQVESMLDAMDVDFAYFLGYVVGDGHISDSGRVRITGTDKNNILRVGKLIAKKYGWSYRIKTWGKGKWEGSRKKVWQLDINNDSGWGLWLRKSVYTTSREKKVPKFILNNSLNIISAFFDGYYAADGRLKGHERYKYKGWTTKSAVLNLGLIYLINILTGQKAKTKVTLNGNARYYYTQLRGSGKTGKGKHLLKRMNEVIRIKKVSNSKEGVFFDLQTESRTFASGANLVKIHNSPRRGYEFVTRKITQGAARIKLGLAEKLYLGNLDAKRDWGHAREYVKVMHTMLQQKSPEDFVIGTGETHSVREFAEAAFGILGLNYMDYVVVDKNFFRPAEVDLLIADTAKAKSLLGWEYKLSFRSLVEEMVRHDYDVFKSRGKGD